MLLPKVPGATSLHTARCASRRHLELQCPAQRLCAQLPSWGAGSKTLGALVWSADYTASAHCALSEWKLLSRVQLAATPWTVHGIPQARRLEWVAFPISRGSFQPRIDPRSPTLRADSLPAEPHRTPKNTGVGSLSLLQVIFQTQKSNQCLLHFRQILYQLSYKGNPMC